MSSRQTSYDEKYTSTAAPRDLESRQQEFGSFNDVNTSSVIINNNDTSYSAIEEVDENLSLEEKTKEFILKALKKHKGRRKDAAEELGISERTLYRKIKEYDIEI